MYVIVYPYVKCLTNKFYFITTIKDINISKVNLYKYRFTNKLSYSIQVMNTDMLIHQTQL